MKDYEQNLQKEQRIEAINRMKILNIESDLIEKFAQGYLDLSYLSPEDQKQVYQEVKDFEEKEMGLVYYVIIIESIYKHTINLCFVSPYKEKWAYERRFLPAYKVFKEIQEEK